MQRNIHNLLNLLSKQLNHFFNVNLPDDFDTYIDLAQAKTLKAASSQKAFSALTGIDPYHTTQWTFFLYYLSHLVGTRCENGKVLANQIYYLNKIMHSVDWYWEIRLPEYCWAEHPVGTVLGRARYSDYFFIYQGCTVGGNHKGESIFYPVIGRHVILYANSMIIGDSHIGNHVMISAGSYIKDQTVPDCCTVFGRSPDLKIIRKSEPEMMNKLKHIWRER